LRYLVSKLTAQSVDIAYKVYVSDSLFYYFGQHKMMTKRFAEIIKPVNEGADADEIISDITKRAGLTVIEKKEVADGNTI